MEAQAEMLRVTPLKAAIGTRATYQLPRKAQASLCPPNCISSE